MVSENATHLTTRRRPTCRKGPVFRVSPNELSFASVKSWKAIYAPPPGDKPLLKTEFYDMYGSGFKSLCVASTRDPAEHNRMKRILAAGFSNKALLEQEEIVSQCIDTFVEKIGHIGDQKEGIDIKQWYEMIAFDILGEMAFGESFHCVEDGKNSSVKILRLLLTISKRNLISGNR